MLVPSDRLTIANRLAVAILRWVPEKTKPPSPHEASANAPTNAEIPEHFLNLSPCKPPVNDWV
jgi:hypothetical protein